MLLASAVATEKSHTVIPAISPIGILENEAVCDPNWISTRSRRTLVERCAALVKAPSKPSKEASMNAHGPATQRPSLLPISLVNILSKVITSTRAGRPNERSIRW